MYWQQHDWQTAGVDYDNTMLTATFGSGVTKIKVRVPVTRDNIVEGREEFDLFLTVPSSLGPAITAIDKTRAVGVIVDSTSKCVL